MPGIEIGSDRWIQMVVRGAGQLGVSIERYQADLFARHAVLLLEWNRKHNLTAIVDPTAVAVKHFLDAVAPLKHIPAAGRLLDIGTGGGFPGIPLKIMRPVQEMVLIDGGRKKISFVRHVIRQLGLQHIQALQVRAETLGRREERPRFDVIVCRALSDLQQVVRWAVPLLALNGRIVAYRGPEDPGQPRGPAPTPLLSFGGRTLQAAFHAYHLPILGDARQVAVLTPF